MMTDADRNGIVGRSIVGLVLGALTAASLLGVASSAADSPNAIIETSVVLLAEKLDGRKAELSADRPALRTDR